MIMLFYAQTTIGICIKVHNEGTTILEPIIINVFKCKVYIIFFDFV